MSNNFSFYSSPYVQCSCLNIFYLFDRFGPGPYYIEVDVDFNKSHRFFTLQTASSDSMHHAVYMFMDMVDNKAWDDSTIVHNKDHILEISPFTIDGKKHEVDKKRHLQQLAFLEYSEKHPHEPNTLGFSGVGPGMYLNLKDNSELHGPGGNSDPCFAKVVIGLSTISHLKTISYQFREGDGEKQMTAIKSMKIAQFSDSRLKMYGLPK